MKGSRRSVVRAALTALTVVAVAGCAGAAASSPPAPGLRVELTVLGAASLQGMLAKVKTTYEASHAGVTLVMSTDSSAALEAKIEQGAPADVFLSADTSNPQKLVDAGFAAGAVTPFASNFLTVIVPANNPARITSPADLAKAGTKVIAAGDSVPITEYANQVVANLASVPGYPPGFVAAYAANVLSKEENVAAVVAKVELGEGDAGLVYVTDAAASTAVRSIDIPAAANVAATYAGVVVKASTNQAAARSLLDWLAGPDGRAILQSFGFGPAR